MEYGSSLFLLEWNFNLLAVHLLKMMDVHNEHELDPMIDAAIRLRTELNAAKHGCSYSRHQGPSPMLCNVYERNKT